MNPANLDRATEILKAATPRPWHLMIGIPDSRNNQHHFIVDAIIGANEREIIYLGDSKNSFNDYHNAQLTVLAVNSFEAQRECIRDLAGLLTEVKCILSAKEFDSLAHGLDPALARAQELLK